MSGYLYILNVISAINSALITRAKNLGILVYKFGETVQTMKKRLSGYKSQKVNAELLFSFSTDYPVRRESVFKFHIKNMKEFIHIDAIEYYSCDINILKEMLYMFSIIDIEFINKYYNIKNKIKTINMDEYNKDYNIQKEKYKNHIIDKFSNNTVNELIMSKDIIIDDSTINQKLEDSSVQDKSNRTNNKPICPKCNKTFANNGNLNVHLKTICSDKIDYIECEYCNQQFKRRDHLTAHYSTCKNKLNKEDKNDQEIKLENFMLKNEISSLKDKHDIEISSLKDKHDNEISSLKDKYDNLYKLHEISEKNHHQTISRMENEIITLTKIITNLTKNI